MVLPYGTCLYLGVEGEVEAPHRRIILQDLSGIWFIHYPWKPGSCHALYISIPDRPEIRLRLYQSGIGGKRAGRKGARGIYCQPPRLGFRLCGAWYKHAGIYPGSGLKNVSGIFFRAGTGDEAHFRDQHLRLLRKRSGKSGGLSENCEKICCRKADGVHGRPGASE